MTNEYELIIIKNFIKQKPIVYRRRNQNYQIIGDILMNGTSHSGMTSCIEKCRELEIDPYGYKI